MSATQGDIAAFYWLALQLGLLPQHVPIAWADDLIAESPAAPTTPLIDLSLAANLPVDKVMDALRCIGPNATHQCYRLIGGLFHFLVTTGRVSDQWAASKLYELARVTRWEAGEVLGAEISCIDEEFEPRSGGPENGRRVLRRFLKQFEEEVLPRVE